jgi:monoamine oxidase
VKSISDKGRSVAVTLVNGTQVTADYVIVTVPLGVLKEGRIKFSPQLPPAKLAAIKNLVSICSWSDEPEGADNLI